VLLPTNLNKFQNSNINEFFMRHLLISSAMAEDELPEPTVAVKVERKMKELIEQVTSP
jgi:hypothetical protein